MKRAFQTAQNSRQQKLAELRHQLQFASPQERIAINAQIDFWRRHG